jgi:hypothetical protein
MAAVKAKLSVSTGNYKLSLATVKATQSGLVIKSKAVRGDNEGQAVSGGS